MREPNTDQPNFIYDIVRTDGRLERCCTHGIGHTVGHLRPNVLSDRNVWIHGCDGCCETFVKMKATELSCQYCRKIKPDVCERQDPYNADVNNDPTSTHIACDSCNTERADDI